MRIDEMFKKEITRPISGVIKVGHDEENNVYQELDEYVVTGEINKHLNKFYDNYLKSIDGTTDKIGVWISGFFGSGKSHFLKILSYLLENKVVEGKEAIDYFDEKIEDKMFLADMKRTGNIDTEVILFNIDAKSPMAGKSDQDTLLRIFLKMFHNHQGFYGESPGIAYMEKYLTEEGKYDKFREEFERISGHNWEERRRAFYFIRDQVVKALSVATGMSEESAREWHKNGSKEFDIDIHGFAKEVKEYLDTKSRDTKLVFLVDEVGQYIGDDSTLMLNLQTIAEELGSQCQGRAWLIVTSQEAIDELAKRIRENDFSKIQGRFDTKLSLSSISVDEVITKRILDKKDYVEERLKQIYFEKSAVLKNLINFRDSRSDFLGYRDEYEFAAVYPFVPYQFKLLQNVFEQIRRRGSSGKHLSEGERSMLSAFKESAIHYKDQEEGILIPFYAFYETIYEFLNPSIQRVIDGAERNPALNNDEFNINLLKVLFMIKYIEELPANVDNLTVLMASKIDEDKIALKEKITKSLSLLTREYLIQKNGEVYIFLTDDEQDVNKDIKLTKVDEELLKKELREYMFRQFYENIRYRYSPNYDFDFNKKMDEKEYGRQTADLGINVLSPLSVMYNVPEINLMLQTKDAGEMIIKLPENGYLEELEEVLRVNEYTRTLNINELAASKRLIINGKIDEERTRRARVRENLEDAIKSATIYIDGEKIEKKGSLVKEIINNGMKVLTDSVYTKLTYVNKFIKNKDELQDILNIDSQQVNMDDSLVNKNELAIKEVHDLIKLERDMNKQTRIKPIIDHFSQKPYGWNELDILGLILTLLKDQKINLKYQGSNLTTASNNIVQTITKSSEQDKIIVSIREEIDERLLRKVKGLIRELWDRSNIHEDEDGLGEDLKNLISNQITEINNYLEKYEGRKYPGKSLLEKGLEYFEDLMESGENIPLFRKFVKMEDDLLIWEEDISYVKSFFRNQKELFDTGLKIHKLYEENSEYLNTSLIREAYENLVNILDDYLPYGRIKDIPEYANIIEEEVNKILEDKKNESLKQIKEDLSYLELISDHPGVKGSTKEEYKVIFDGLKDNIENYKEILRIEGIKTRSLNFRTTFEQKIYKEIDEFEPPVDIIDPIAPISERETKQIRIRELTRINNLKTVDQVDTFLRELGKKLKEELKHHDLEIID
ncbi:MAG: BREX system P-loop protein BrxC [Tissierellaceae bacterium]|nr:BREX system P-loop protein BrxC [Tissierellaceae bacterium]